MSIILFPPMTRQVYACLGTLLVETKCQKRTVIFLNKIYNVNKIVFFSHYLYNILYRAILLPDEHLWVIDKSLTSVCLLDFLEVSTTSEQESRFPLTRPLLYIPPKQCYSRCDGILSSDVLINKTSSDVCTIRAHISRQSNRDLGLGTVYI